jgi:DNA-binding transcriptional LysR family regulator
MLARFYTLYPNVRVEMLLSDGHEDIVASGVDVAIRASRHFVDSSLVARHLCDNFMCLVASPLYLSRRGVPGTVQDLVDHNFLIYSLFKEGQALTLEDQHGVDSVRVSSNFSSNNGDTNLQAALLGIGIAELPPWMVAEHIRRGELQRVLPDYRGANVPFKVVYPSRRFMPAHIRCFITYLIENISCVMDELTEAD